MTGETVDEANAALDTAQATYDARRAEWEQAVGHRVEAELRLSQLPVLVTSDFRTIQAQPPAAQRLAMRDLLRAEAVALAARDDAGAAVVEARQRAAQVAARVRREEAL